MPPQAAAAEHEVGDSRSRMGRRMSDWGCQHRNAATGCCYPLCNVLSLSFKGNSYLLLTTFFLPLPDQPSSTSPPLLVPPVASSLGYSSASGDYSGGMLLPHQSPRTSGPGQQPRCVCWATGQGQSPVRDCKSFSTHPFASIPSYHSPSSCCASLPVFAQLLTAPRCSSFPAPVHPQAAPNQLLHLHPLHGQSSQAHQHRRWPESTPQPTDGEPCGNTDW